MQFNPYGRDPILLGVDLVNDPVRDPEHLARRCEDAGLVLERPVQAEDVPGVLAFLRRWEGVVDADDAAGRSILLNVLLAEFAAPPQLTDHAGTGWHLHFRDADLPVHRQVASLISVGTALHLTGLGMSRLGRCAATNCSRVFADVSKNGRQRFCSPGCGNRAAVQRHRARAAGVPLAP